MAKKKQRTRFPIFSPPFSPQTAVIVIGIITGIIAINVTSFQQYQKDEQAQAAREAKNILTNVNLLSVLGSSTEAKNPTNEETLFKKKPDVAYWYDVVAKRPDYRDAYIILASLAYNDTRCQLAQSLFSQAYTLDPNLPTDTPLSQAIEKCDKQ